MENFVPSQKSTESYKEALVPITQSHTINPCLVLIHPPSHPVYSKANPRNRTISLVNVSVLLKDKAFKNHTFKKSNSLISNILTVFKFPLISNFIIVVLFLVLKNQNLNKTHTLPLVNDFMSPNSCLFVCSCNLFVKKPSCL